MLKIRDEIDLKELEKFSFKRNYRKQENIYDAKEKGLPEFYNEVYYTYNDGTNEICIVESRQDGAGWINLPKIRQIDVYEIDYEVGVSMGCYDVIFDLIRAGYVDKVGE